MVLQKQTQLTVRLGVKIWIYQGEVLFARVVIREEQIAEKAKKEGESNAIT